MKRIFAFLASAVLACSLLAAPCFAAEPEPLPGATARRDRPGAARKTGWTGGTAV